MSTIPAYYNFLDFFNSQHTPNTFHSKNTALTRYFQKYLLQKLQGVIEFEGCPDTWNMDFISTVLLIQGYFAIINQPQFGVIPQPCTFGGERDVYYQPAKLIVTNPLFKPSDHIEARIGEEAALVRLQPNYGSAWDLISFYADQMSICSEAIGSNLINAKLAMIFGVENKQQAETLKKMFDEINSGLPGVFVDKNLFDEEGKPRWQPFVQNLSQNYIGDVLLADLKKIENEFCSKVGIPNSNFEKNAHLLESEVNSNNADTQVLLTKWVESMTVGLEDANRLFGLNLSVKPRFKEELREEVYLEDDRRENIDSGDDGI